MNEKFSLSVSSFALTFLSHCFSLHSHFCILSHFEIIVKSLVTSSASFFVEIQLKKAFGCRNRYTGLPNGLNTSLVVDKFLKISFRFFPVFSSGIRRFSLIGIPLQPLVAFRSTHSRTIFYRQGEMMQPYLGPVLIVEHWICCRNYLFWNSYWKST